MKTFHRNVDGWTVKSQDRRVMAYHKHDCIEVHIKYFVDMNLLCTNVDQSIMEHQNIDKLHHYLNKTYTIFLEKEVIETFMKAIGFNLLNR